MGEKRNFATVSRRPPLKPGGRTGKEGRGGGGGLGIREGDARPPRCPSRFIQTTAKTLEDTPRTSCSIVSPGSGTPSNHQSAQFRADWFDTPPPQPPPPSFAFSHRVHSPAANRSPFTAASPFLLWAWKLGAREKEECEGKGGGGRQPVFLAGGCRDRGFPPTPAWGERPVYLPGQSFPPRNSYGLAGASSFTPPLATKRLAITRNTLPQKV